MGRDRARLTARGGHSRDPEPERAISIFHDPAIVSRLTVGTSVAMLQDKPPEEEKR